MENSNSPLGEDPKVREALRLAASKRTSSEPDVIKPPKILGDLRAEVLPVAEYCSRCRYPLKDQVCYECRDRAQKDELITREHVRKIGGWKAWNQYTLARFVRTKFNEQAYQASLEFTPDRSLLIWGPKGTGKSHLSAIIKRPLILKGWDVETVSVIELLADAKSKIKEGQVLQSHVRRCIDARVLSLEDMAVEKPSEFVIEFYYRVIEGRYKDDKPGLIITMNQSLDELNHYWLKHDPHQRISSRLKELCRVVSLMGEKDWRAEKWG